LQQTNGITSRPSAAAAAGAAGTPSNIPSGSAKPEKPAAERGFVKQPSKPPAGTKHASITAVAAAVRQPGPSIPAKKLSPSTAAKPHGFQGPAANGKVAAAANGKVAAVAKPAAAKPAANRPNSAWRASEEELALQVDPAPLDAFDSGSEEMGETVQTFAVKSAHVLEKDISNLGKENELDPEKTKAPAAAAPPQARGGGGSSAAAAAAGSAGNSALASLQERKQALASLAGRHQQRNEMQNQQRIERAARASVDGSTAAATASGTAGAAPSSKKQPEAKPVRPASAPELGKGKASGGKPGAVEKVAGEKIEAQKQQQQEQAADEAKANLSAAIPGMKSRAENRLKKAGSKSGRSTGGKGGKWSLVYFRLLDRVA
jgi:hypothetical protein